MVIGRDQLCDLHNWYKYKCYIDKIDILCFNRRSKENKKILVKHKNIKFIDDFNYDLSSSFIREKFLENVNVNMSAYLPEEVLFYIKENKLYDS